MATATVDDDPGWFFVIKERPGEPRFGLDIDRDGAIQVWNDLAWDDVVPGGSAGDFIVIADAADPQPADDGPQRERTGEGGAVGARITSSGGPPESHRPSSPTSCYQAPVLVGVHASEMLPES